VCTEARDSRPVRRFATESSLATAMGEGCKACDESREAVLHRRWLRTVRDDYNERISRASFASSDTEGLDARRTSERDRDILDDAVEGARSRHAQHAQDACSIPRPRPIRPPGNALVVTGRCVRMGFAGIRILMSDRAAGVRRLLITRMLSAPSVTLHSLMRPRVTLVTRSHQERAKIACLQSRW